MHKHRPPDLSRSQRYLAWLIDAILLWASLLVLFILTAIVYLNVAILVGGTYEGRIPYLWIELLILGPASALAIAIVPLYFRVLGRSGGTPGRRLACRSHSQHKK